MVYKYPIVGIGANVDDDSPGVQNIYDSYVDAVYDAGCLPLIIPLPSISAKNEYDALARRAIECVDGLLLSGGNDVDARIYGEDNMPFNGAFSEERDLFEIALVKSAAETQKPIFGICRGVQMLNAAMGGTLYQDIERQNEGKNVLAHRQKAPSYSAVHSVAIEKGSVLEGIILKALPRESEQRGADGRIRIGVNSFHHQAVKDAARGFKASASTGDGIIEAIEPEPGNVAVHPFTIGVQWHPERMFKYHAHARALFAKFAETLKGDAALNNG
ncbi:MAG: gamma-glutamyl-gamma-aminobutyrate hydrolase family protein [Synergistaceae bacterium]|jgi:putative glutamine amidotransferase|nr:gamma-glutamyl-gamma-aminobutyrate hydrolase family protein [Synergistaceae bacterium]